MKILIDHCIDWRLGRAFSAHTVESAGQRGWDTLRNGKLLEAAAAAGFDVLLTVDRNLKHEQNLANLPIAVVVLVAKSNRLVDLLPLVPAVGKAVASLSGKVLVEVKGS
jgi:predicted nuclease of predicted toxin-antitoxin system